MSAGQEPPNRNAPGGARPKDDEWAEIDGMWDEAAPASAPKGPAGVVSAPQENAWSGTAAEKTPISISRSNSWSETEADKTPVSHSGVENWNVSEGEPTPAAVTAVSLFPGSHAPIETLIAKSSDANSSDEPVIPTVTPSDENKPKKRTRARGKNKRNLTYRHAQLKKETDAQATAPTGTFAPSPTARPKSTEMRPVKAEALQRPANRPPWLVPAIVIVATAVLFFVYLAVKK